MLNANEQFCRLVNYPLSELQQLSVDTILLFPDDPATFWRTERTHCRVARLTDSTGRVRHVRVLGIPDVAVADAAVPDEQSSQILLIYGTAGSTPETTGQNDCQADLSQATYAIHSASSAAEIVQVTSDWCQTLVSHYVGVGTFDLRGSWSWACRVQGLSWAIADGLDHVHAEQLLSSLQYGRWVRQQIEAPLPDTMVPSYGPNCASYVVQEANDPEEVLALPTAPHLNDNSFKFEALLVPIEHQGKVSGALLLSPSLEQGDRGDEDIFPTRSTAVSPATLPPEEIELATTLAKHAALALANVKRRETPQDSEQTLVRWVHHQVQHLQQALNFEAAIKRITENIRDSLDERYIFETVMRELGETLVLDYCTVGFYDRDQKTVTVRYSHTTTEDACPVQQDVSLLSDDDEIYGLLLQGRYIQLSPWSDVSDRRTVAYSTTLAYPMLVDQQVVGDLWLYRPKHSSFSEQEIQLVEQIANQCAVGLHQARLYQQAQDQVKSLETMGDLKDDFLNTVSHELRTPVTNIKMTAEMLDLALATQQITDTRVSRYIKILHAEAQREMELINDLLDLQRLDAGMQTLNLKYLEIASWLTRIFDSFRERAEENQQQLHVNILTEVTHIASDESSLKRIIAELVNNACKYTPPHESIAIEGRIGFAGLTLSVCNSGVEIPVQEQERIFEKFYRIRGSDRRKQGGTGLGLSLVKQLAQHMGGDICLVSGNGLTSFTLSLPLLKLPDPESTALS
ncbi:MAG: PAS domain-containing sensor histidine kinase [Elainellaceae cyanobacterium]